MYKLHIGIGHIGGGYSGYRINKKQPDTLRSNNRKWASIIRICSGCADPLRGYDTQRGYAFCISCREVLFPETVNQHKSVDKKYHQFRSRGHF
jgi:hypothetical protein